MNILIVGSGAREYSIGLALKKDTNVKNIYFAPGNGATEFLGSNVSYNNFEELVKFAKTNNIDLTIVGPEAPLVDGIVDIFQDNNLVIFGCSKSAARLEGSKAFMKDFLKRHNIPTASYIQSSNIDEISSFIDTLKPPIVVKADGLCAGKGVIITKDKDEAKKVCINMLNGDSFGDAGKKVVVEEFLDGYELSVFAICDGNDYVILPAAQDHKRLLDENKGPNTGGMGAYSPTPLINENIYKQVEDNIVKPTLKGMQDENNAFSGVLFIGLMIVENKAYVLEYNVRFGDPECEVIMPLLKTPASELFYKAATRNLSNLKLQFNGKYALGVVMASKDYPYKTSKIQEIKITQNNDENSHISYAGVTKKDGILYASGGRVLVCIGIGNSPKEAQSKAYELCEKVDFDGKQFRKDIGYLVV